MAKAIIFDMDGVIVDTEPGFFYCINRVLERYGKSMTKKQNEQFIGVSNEYMWNKTIEMFSLDTTVDGIFEEMTEIREEFLAKEGLKPISGTIELIESLSKLDIPLAVASSSPMEEIKRVVKLFQIESCFDVLMTGEDCEESKPHPDIFLYTAEKLSVNPKDCLVIEDSLNGVIAAKKAGMKAIGYCNPEFGLDHIEGADMEVNAISKITTSLCLEM